MTEGVRGEGGVLKNRDGRRFMFENIPDNYKAQTADTPEEGWKYTQGDKNSRRPPELLTRDHVARMIVREVREGRGSPHGGVFLDIAWIKEKLPNAEEHIKRKLPSMYHQFMQLAGIDITKEPMEIGPTTHYIMGGIRVDGDTQMSTVPGLFAAGECGAGLHGANRLGGNSLSDLIVFGKRAGEYAAKFAKEHGNASIDKHDVDAAAARRRWRRSIERATAEGPYQVQEALQEMMQDYVNIVRARTRWKSRSEHRHAEAARAARAACKGTASTTRVGTRRSISTTCSRCPKRSRARRSSARRAAAAISATTIRTRTRRTRRSTSSSEEAPTARWSCRANRSRRCPTTSRP